VAHFGEGSLENRMLTTLDHPLGLHWLAALRDVETEPAEFRRLLRSLSLALFYEAARELPTAACRVRTPLAEHATRRLEAAPILAPVLRAGLGMVDGILALVPDALVCHVGLYRDHATLLPVPYYTPSLKDARGRQTFVLDPMLATGGSAIAAIELVRSWGGPPPRLLSVIGAPEGVARVREAHPDVPIYLAALDERLNEQAYIVPGLGDAGDRQFGC
jgi:uracil phosphoribosyltransferase